MKAKNTLTSRASAVVLALALGLAAAQAQAIILLTPADADATTNNTSNLGNIADINTAFGTAYPLDMDMVYKMNVDGLEEGVFQASYVTTFDNEPDDPADALITWVGPAFINCPECFLIVKDGNQVPAQYLFDLADWDGMESIQMTGFWPNQGAISHVEIWSNGGGGDDDNGVPEPGVVFLMGAGLLGLGLARRRKSA